MMIFSKQQLVVVGGGAILIVLIVLGVLMHHPKHDQQITSNTETERMQQLFQPAIAFAADESPRFQLPEVEQASNNDIAELKNVSFAVTDPKGMDASGFFDPILSANNMGAELVLEPKEYTFVPGRYRVEAEYTTKKGLRNITQDFLWGVLALNTNKAQYIEGETGYLQFAVLDEKGNTLCNAELLLRVISPSGQESVLTTQEKNITKNSACGPNNVIDEPDYFSYFSFFETGIYRFELLATTKNGEYMISDYVEVYESVGYDVERTGPTRIWPWSPYDMSIMITAVDDFSGQLTEYVPKGFVIECATCDDMELADEEIKRLTWNVDLLAGQQQVFMYSFDAPDVSPEFYLTGPLRLSNQTQVIFEEQRLWQIAGDASPSITSVTDSPDPIAAGQDIYWSVDWNDGDVGEMVKVYSCKTDAIDVGGTTAAEEQIDANNRDAMSVNSDERINYYDGTYTYLLLGEYVGETFQTGFQFPLSIPQGATIDEATLELKSTNFAFGNDFTATISAHDVDNASVFNDSHTHTIVNHEASVTTAEVDWTIDISAWANTNWKTSPDISTILQEIVDRPGWTSGNYISIVIDPGTPSDDFIGIADYNQGASNAAILNVTSTSVGSGCTGGAWCVSPVFTDRDPEGMCYYNTTVSDIGLNNYYVFVCDNEGNCSASTSGSFTVQEQSPTAPTELLLENIPNPVNVSTNTPIFSAVYTDPNTLDTANKYCIHVNTQSDFAGTDMWYSDGASCSTGSSMTNCTQGTRCEDIKYNGTTLSLDGSVYYWRINYWDDSGNVSASSTTGNFTMADGNGTSTQGVRLKGYDIKGGVRLK